MATVSKLSKTLELMYVSVADSGKEVIELRKFRNVKTEALADDVLLVGNEIAKLTLGNFTGVRSTEVSDVLA